MQIELTPDTSAAAEAAPSVQREATPDAAPRLGAAILRDSAYMLYGTSGRPQAAHVSGCDDEGFAAGLRRMAELQPEAIFEAITPQDDGTACKVTLHARDAYGQPYAVQLTVTRQDVVDNIAMRGTLAEPHDVDQPAWHVVLEEAYSWMRVMTMPRGSSASQCRAELDRTSSMEEVLFALTGQSQWSPASTDSSRATAAPRASNRKTALPARTGRRTALLH